MTLVSCSYTFDRACVQLRGSLSDDEQQPACCLMNRDDVVPHTEFARQHAGMLMVSRAGSRDKRRASGGWPGKSREKRERTPDVKIAHVSLVVVFPECLVATAAAAVNACNLHRRRCN